MTLALAIFPLIATLVVGWLLVATRVLPKDQWHAIEVLSFRLLIPIVLIEAIADAELSFSQYGTFSLGLLATLTVTGLIVLTLRLVFSQQRLPNPAFTTLFQTTTRWNGFIALAAAELMIGQAGLTLIAVAFAALIPLINMVNILVLAIFGTGKVSARAILVIILKNPLVQGSLIGVALSLSEITIPVPIAETMDLIGRAALGVGLLAVGAGISMQRLFRPSPKVLIGVVLRLVLAPLVFVLIANALGLSALQTVSGAFVFAVPAATNGYIVAKQMGGDADLYADILTWQTVLSMALLPVLAGLLLN